MMDSADIFLDSDLFQVKGALTFATVSLLRNKGNQVLKEATMSELVFSFEKVTHCNSGALALLTSWERQAKSLGKSISFINIPSELMDIAKLSNLHKILNLK